MIKFKRRAPISFIFFLLFSFGLNAVGLRGEKDIQEDYPLSSLKIFNRVVLLAKEQYVEPTRFKPADMLMAALYAVEKQVPEIVVGEPKNGKLSVQVGKKSETFAVGNLASLWDLSLKLRDIFRFVENNLPKQTDKQAIEYAAINGMLSKLDPHSMLLEPRFSRDMKLSTKGEFGGLGIVISIKDGFLTVISPVEGTPAANAGIKALDRITKIEQDSTINMGLEDAVERLRGPAGTKVALTVLRAGESEPRQFNLVRDVIKVDSVSSHLISKKIGYVKIKSFQSNTASDLRHAIETLKKEAEAGLVGLIIDLRNNPGGLLDQSVAVADLFLDGGIVVVTQGSKAENREEEYASNGPEKTMLPVVVLVNEGAASASEIVAGALKNRGRGVVVGQQTFGKGSVQMLFDFPDRSSLKLTIAQYLTPGDESIQSVGITPDIYTRKASIDAKNGVDLFNSVREREVDLIAHLDDERVAQHRPSYELVYLGNDAKDDSIENLVSNQFKDDFEIQAAKQILLETDGASRDALLGAAGRILPKIRDVEFGRVAEALKKLGIDWTAAPNGASKPELTLQVIKAKPVVAGETLQLSLEATNHGKVPVWQLYGVSKSSSQLLADREFVFGKLMPKEKRQWTVDVKVPREELTRHDLMRVEFKGNGNQPFASIDVPISIQGLAEPSVAHTYYIDNSKGAADGALHVGETVEMVVLLKNVGKGSAEESTVLLKNQGGSEVFIEDGRQNVGKIPPGATAAARLRFSIRKGAEQVKLQLQIFDSVSQNIWTDSLVLPIEKEAAPANKLEGLAQGIKEQVLIRSTPAVDGTVIGILKKNDWLQTTHVMGNMLRVCAGLICGYVSNGDIVLVENRPENSQIEVNTHPAVQWMRTPPRIEWEMGDKEIIVTSKSQAKLMGKVTAQKPIKDVIIFVNDKKVSYRSYTDKPTNSVQFGADIQLKPGVNLVTVIAREDDTYGQRETLTIFSQAGDPLSEKNRLRI